MDHVCYSTRVLFTASSIVQMGLVLKLLAPPTTTCTLSCVAALICGFTLPSTFMCIVHVFKSETLSILEKIYLTFLAATVPFVSSFFANYLQTTCRDPLWTSWFLQGCTLPTIFVAVYGLLFLRRNES